MPQDGANNYQYPLGTPGIPDQTIESEAYNTFLDDLVTNDLNIARPIHRGGTGATTANAARAALDAEVSSQVVTNYNSHVWESGSFTSEASATGGPFDGHVITGFSAISGDSNNISLMAFDHNLGNVHFRIKASGVWSSWTSGVNDTYVNTIGDTMSGDLTIAKVNPIFTLAKTASGQSNLIYGKLNGIARWQIELGNQANETGGNSGSNFVVSAFADDGSFLHSPFAVDRASGAASFINSMGVGYDVVLGSAGGTRTLYFQNTTNGVFVRSDGTNLQLGAAGSVTIPGGLIVTGGITSASPGSIHSATGITAVGNITTEGAIGGNYFVAQSAEPIQYFFRNQFGTQMAYLQYTAGNMRFGVQSDVPLALSFEGGVVKSYLRLYANAGRPAKIWFDDVGSIEYAGTVVDIKGETEGVRIKHGAAQVHMISTGTFFYTGSNGWSDTGNLTISGTGYRPGGGDWADSSDARIKTVLGDYVHGLAEIKQLMPRRYKFNGTVTPAADPPSGMVPPESRDVKAGQPNPLSGHYQAAIDQTEFVGLVAQECEASMPEMVTQIAAKIDGASVSDLRILNTTALVFALVNAVKELATRVEQLEAAG